MFLQATLIYIMSNDHFRWTGFIYEAHYFLKFTIDSKKLTMWHTPEPIYNFFSGIYTTSVRGGITANFLEFYVFFPNYTIFSLVYPKFGPRGRGGCTHIGPPYIHQ